MSGIGVMGSKNCRSRLPKISLSGTRAGVLLVRCSRSMLNSRCLSLGVSGYGEMGTTKLGQGDVESVQWWVGFDSVQVLGDGGDFTSPGPLERANEVKALIL